METKDPHPGAKKEFCERFDAPSLLLHTTSRDYLREASLLCPRSQPIPSANRRLYPLVGSLGRFYNEHLLGSECCYMASRILAMGCLARGHSPSAEASGIIQSKAPRLSCHQICRPIPALGTRLQARHLPIVERDGQG